MTLNTSNSLPDIVPDNNNNLNHVFLHEGVVFNTNTSNLSFSKEAKIALQELIDKINARYSQLSPHIDTSNETPSQEDVSKALGTMISTGVGKKTIQKFIDRVRSLLNPKNRSLEKIASIGKKVEKTVNEYTKVPETKVPEKVAPVVILIQYRVGDSLDSVPITIWPGKDLTSLLSPIENRLNYKYNIQPKKRNS